MVKTRELTVQERGAIISALAEARTRNYNKASDLREKARQIEDDGKTGYLALDREADQHEILAEESDILMELAVCDRIAIISSKEDIESDG